MEKNYKLILIKEDEYPNLQNVFPVDWRRIPEEIFDGIGARDIGEYIHTVLSVDRENGMVKNSVMYVREFIPAIDSETEYKFSRVSPKVEIGYNSSNHKN